MPAADKSPDPSAPAVVVIGEHPAASLCALLLAEAKVPVAVASAGATPNAGRLVTLNPAFFGLHPSLAPLRDALDLEPVTAVRFLGPDGQAAQTRPKTGDDAGPLAYVVGADELARAVRDLAAAAGVPLLDGTAAVARVDESGVEMTVGRRSLRPALVCVADPLDAASTTALGAAAFPGQGAQRQTTAKLVGDDLAESADAATLAMSLDLGGGLDWGWLLRRGGEVQLCVQGPTTADPAELLAAWTRLLVGDGLLAESAKADGRTFRHETLPLAGAMTRDVVARRALLLGPAGGFYSASGEDAYPACWSALFAADVAAKALGATHVQDALAAYRGKWGSTLGDYLRGPQQNLRFLLPLVYKNPTMTDRLADSILLGDSLVK